MPALQVNELSRVGGHRNIRRRLGLNRFARTRALPPHKVERWIRHHIEEIGNLENFLPALFEAQADTER